VQKSEKLLRLEIQVGDEKRQIVAGISKHYKPEDLIGKNVIVVANLAPAKLMGLESSGMLLAASSEDGKLSILTTMIDIDNGSVVR
jgi:methionyl-tRNA synthetase